MLTFDDVLDVLPGILRVETERLAEERGLGDTDALMLLGAGWLGWNDEAGKFELVLFENYKNDYAPQRGAKGLIGIPNVPASYVLPGFIELEPSLRAMAGLRAIASFTRDHAGDFGMAPIGGEIVLSELRPDGISTKVVGRLDGFEQLGAEIAATWEDVYAGGEDFSGVDLVNRTAGQEAALRKFEAIARRTAPAAGPTAPVGELSRQQRRHAEKMARKAGRRAA